MKPFVERYFLHLAALIVLLAAFNLFHRLGESELQNWDESRYGITAYDMLRSGDFIRTTVLGVPDYWNLKPPLGYWAICASYKIFGVNRFGLRFPAALSALLCVILLMGLARKYFSAGTALLAGLILATNIHFITRHAGRSGDLDAMLTLLYLLFVWILAA
ncbi:MAG: glycosyltransferase family 39 protein, partial [Spirochaetia bacterium]|nr:glycosyltransferase family 39 protein [Spirochaetia bacterium]